MRGALLLLVAATTPLVAQGRHGGSAALPNQFTWQDTTYIDAIIRLQIDNGPQAVMPALTYDTTLMLPLRQYFELAEIRPVVMALRDSALATLEPSHVVLRFKPGAKLLTRGGVAVPYDSLDVIWWDGDLFVSAQLLDSLLGTSTVVEWTSLTAMVGHSGGLPVVARARRARRQEMIWTQRPEPNVLDLSLRNRLVDGAVGSWSLTAVRRGPFDEASLELGLGAGLAGGSAELRPLVYASNGLNNVDLRWSWSRVWADSRTLQQLRIGDVPSAGLRSRLLTGVVATNAPYIRSSEFDVEQLVSHVPAGWEAELYEGGRLMAYSDENTLGAFRVPLQLGYGQNPFEVVMYGPGGETIKKTRTIRVPFSRLPSGHFEYAVAAGACLYDPCDAMASADARYGLSSRVTLQGGWDQFMDQRYGPLSQPYLVVSGAPVTDVGLTGEAVVNDHLRATAQFEPDMDLRATATFTRYSAAGERLSGLLSEATRSEASLFWRPGWINGTLILQGAGVVSSGAALGRQLLRLSGTARFGLFRYGLGVLADNLHSGSVRSDHLAIDASADAFLPGPWKWVRSSTVQGQLAFEPARGLSAMRASMGRTISNMVRLDAGVGWLRGTGMTLELALSTTMHGPRLGARSRVNGSFGSEAMVYSSGSMAFDPRTGLMRFSDMADLDRAGVSGVLFQDNNANGKQDAGEPGLPGIPIRVGGWPAETDAQGRFSAWGMFPSEPLQILVDTLSFTNPQLVLPAAVLRVRPSPNAFGVISVPVAVGAEISGSVVMGGEAVPGVPVILRELNTGAEITTTTFQDGGFYRASVPPGEYEVTLPDAVLDRLRASAPPVSIFVPPGPGEKHFEDLRLVLEPRQ